MKLVLSFFQDNSKTGKGKQYYIWLSYFFLRFFYLLKNNLFFDIFFTFEIIADILFDLHIGEHFVAFRKPKGFLFKPTSLHLNVNSLI